MRQDVQADGLLPALDLAAELAREAASGAENVLTPAPRCAQLPEAAAGRSADPRHSALAQSLGPCP